MEDRPRQVLLIDEDAEWLRTAKGALSETGYQVRTAQVPNAACEHSQEERFDLVLVDLKTAEQEASDFRRIAEIQRGKGGKVVVLFATELTSEKVSSLFSQGADDCLDKPYDLSGLVDLVDEQLAAELPVDEPSRDDNGQQLDQPVKVLIVEDEADWSKRLARYLERDSQQYVIRCADDYVTARSMLEEVDLDVVILDLRLIENSEDFQGMQLLELLHQRGPAVSVIVVSAYGTVAHVKDGFQVYNISAYLSKQTFSPDRFRRAVRRAAHQCRRKA